MPAADATADSPAAAAVDAAGEVVAIQTQQSPASDTNANPTAAATKQRNVAFGKHFQPQCSQSASASASNVYHHQLVLYQQNEQQQQQRHQQLLLLRQQQQQQLQQLQHSQPSLLMHQHQRFSGGAPLAGYHSLRGFSVPNLGGYRCVCVCVL